MKSQNSEQSLNFTLPLNPDGLPIVVLWDQFVVGSSVFIPAINTNKLINQMRSVARGHQITLRAVERIENGRLGVRFWRVL